MNEKLSALMDGELPAAQLDEVLDALKADPALLGNWQQWHLTRDTLQGQADLSVDFMPQFSKRLAAEPIVIAPHRGYKPKRWLVPLSAAASVAFVGLAVWQFSLNIRAVPSQQILAAPEAASKQAYAKVDAAEVRAYLAAHHAEVADPMGRDALATVAFEPGEQR
ncbi:sigma-E factor negative regulatory protein [Chitinibacter sp. S2-10]|uniref:sigma-E factor negative regulatory protein n=1 Tax=Chitinibacter sp. S2-10 TaxID=3373597 RepID=UPI0039772715